MFILDTNVVSELRKAGDGRVDANVISWVAAQDAEHLYVSVITIMELEIGVRRIERRDADQGYRLRRWLEIKVLPEFSDRVLDINTAVAIRCARLHAPEPRSERDALIAATALVHEVTVVTRNVRDFKSTGVTLINPWQRQG